MKHPHAELMKAYADDCTLQIQIKEHWGWVDCAIPRFLPHVEYRIKPEEVKTIRVGRHEWQEPLKEAPVNGEIWTFGCWGVYRTISQRWIEAAIDSGVAHRTKEAAEQHCQAMRCISLGDI